MSTTKKVLIGIFSTLGALLLIAYLIPVLTSLDAFYPGTYINGKDYSFKSPMYADEDMYVSPSDYTITVKFRDGDFDIKGQDIGLAISYKDQLYGIKAEQNPFAWPAHIGKHDYTIEKKISYDEKLLDKVLTECDFMKDENMTDPDEPLIMLSDEGTAYVNEGSMGNRILNKKAIYDAVDDAIMNLTGEVDVESLNCYKEPRYKADSKVIQDCLDYYNKKLAMDITYKMGNVEKTLTKIQLFGFLAHTDAYKPYIDKNKVGVFVRVFAFNNDTVGKNRTFTTHNHNTIEVTSSKYGWAIDQEIEAQQLYDELMIGRDVYREPNLLSSGFTLNEDGDDIGEFYAEVDISAQHVFVYKYGKCIFDSDCVTGNTSLGRGTPGGLYYIYYKQSPAILKGEDYENPVAYWMPFNGGIGFHDATWRGVFGGTIYQYGGSHGCVNLPYSKAQELFGIVQEGMPVVCYY